MSDIHPLGLAISWKADMLSELRIISQKDVPEGWEGEWNRLHALMGARHCTDMFICWTLVWLLKGFEPDAPTH